MDRFFLGRGERTSLHFVSLLRLLAIKIPAVLLSLHGAAPNLDLQILRAKSGSKVQVLCRHNKQNTDTRWRRYFTMVGVKGLD
jgi:hypothetical protein